MERIESKSLEAAAKTAEKKIDEALGAVEDLLVALTAEERQRTLRPPDEFPAAGRSLARAVLEYPAIATSTAYDPKSVLEDLDNVEIIAPLADKVAKLSQLLADSRLAWLAEAYVPSLQVHAVARVIARQDGRVQQLVEPLGEVFASRRERKSKPVQQ